MWLKYDSSQHSILSPVYLKLGGCYTAGLGLFKSHVGFVCEQCSLMELVMHCMITCEELLMETAVVVDMTNPVEDLKGDEVGSHPTVLANDQTASTPC